MISRSGADAVELAPNATNGAVNGVSKRHRGAATGQWKNHFRGKCADTQARIDAECLADSLLEKPLGTSGLSGGLKLRLHRKPRSQSHVPASAGSWIGFHALHVSGAMQAKEPLRRLAPLPDDKTPGRKVKALPTFGFGLFLAKYPSIQRKERPDQKLRNVRTKSDGHLKRFSRMTRQAAEIPPPSATACPFAVLLQEWRHATGTQACPCLARRLFHHA